MELKEASARYLADAEQGVPKGYKQTEVGLIPEDWEVYTIGDFVSISVGRDLKIGNFSIYQDDVFKYPVFSNTVENKGLYGYYNIAEYIGESLTIVGRGVGLGTAFKRSGGYGAIGRLLVVFPHNHVVSNFLAAYINNRVKIFSESGGIPQLTGVSIAKYRIPLPPTKAEQEAIAEALSDADALIELLEQLIAKKRRIKQGAMQELLTGKKRLPGFSGEWEVKRLDAIAEILSGGTPSTNQPEFWDGEILWCTPTDITALKGWKYISKTARTITSQGLKASSAELIPTNSIVMTSRATIGECAINTTPIATNQGFKNFIPFLNIDNQFLYYLLKTKKQEFIGLCGGSTFLEIGKNQLASFEVKLPHEKTEQTAIANILSDMDTEIAVLEIKLTKARQLKQGMMQELLTGKIRLV